MMLDGVFVGFGSVLSVLFEPLGFSSTEISGIGGVTIIMGVFGSFATGFLLQKYHMYKIMLQISCFCTTGFLLIGIYTFTTGNKWLIAINVWCAGFFMVPVIPICMNYADELCFPLEATAVQGLLVSFAQFSAFFIAVGGTKIAEIGSDYCVMMFGGCCTIGCLFSFIVQEKLLKYEYSLRKGRPYRLQRTDTMTTQATQETITL